MYEEIWFDVPGYEGLYKVSNFGRVMNAKREKTLKPAANSRGYLRVLLCKDGKKTNKFVHRLVAAAFVPNPYQKPVVDHIDGNTQNNTAENLRWTTHAENLANRNHRRADIIKIIDEALLAAQMEEMGRILALEQKMHRIELKAKEHGISL